MNEHRVLDLSLTIRYCVPAPLARVLSHVVYFSNWYCIFEKVEASRSSPDRSGKRQTRTLSSLVTGSADADDERSKIQNDEEKVSSHSSSINRSLTATRPELASLSPYSVLKRKMQHTTINRPDETPPQSDAPWRKLTQGKELSRLLYPNPVCCLCTSGMNEKNRNVMVLSWLTATNNEGRFLFSIHKHRCSATLLRHMHSANEEFVLSVPVHGMETLLRQVGSVSGVCGSKFPAYVSTNTEEDPIVETRKRKRPRFPQGIPGLQALSLSAIDRSHEMNSSSTLFGIEGCVAFIVCRIDQIIEDSAVIDQDHWLVVAEMKVAWVHPDYWCLKRNRFLPASDRNPSYLTFLGSQTFGQIVVTNEPDE